MRRKKRPFTLIEVLIAIALATMCIFYLLEFEQGQIKKQSESVKSFKIDEKLQEATVKLYEYLYLNQIDWKTIHSRKGYVIVLDDPEWKADYSFNVIEDKEEISTDAMLATATISLLHRDVKASNRTTTIHFCCVRNAPT